MAIIKNTTTNDSADLRLTVSRAADKSDASKAAAEWLRDHRLFNTYAIYEVKRIGVNEYDVWCELP